MYIYIHICTFEVSANRSRYSLCLKRVQSGAHVSLRSLQGAPRSETQNGFRAYLYYTLLRKALLLLLLL